ncbi:MAG TPA: hypothetical protein VHU81_17580 [Thermoanaerobaculia bacterium]|jgi:hypothetical protein|nr:hypothetical protein [Thermoanaerobaculia bacterium]
MKKAKKIGLSKETLARIDGALSAAPSWSGCPTISCLSCTNDAGCCTA